MVAGQIAGQGFAEVALVLDDDDPGQGTGREARFPTPGDVAGSPHSVRLAAMHRGTQFGDGQPAVPVGVHLGRVAAESLAERLPVDRGG